VASSGWEAKLAGYKLYQPTKGRHMSSAKLGTKELIKLGASQFPDCICIGGRVQHYAESFPEGTRLRAVHCIILCGSQRRAPVLESVCHQHFTIEGYQKDNFSTGSKLHHRRPQTMGGNKTCFWGTGSNTWHEKAFRTLNRMLFGKKHKMRPPATKGNKKRDKLGDKIGDKTAGRRAHHPTPRRTP